MRLTSTFLPGHSLSRTNLHSPCVEQGALIIRNRVWGDLAVTRAFGDRGFKFTKEEG
eukprot:COSAG03_NODE_6766_length_1008_cov_1.691969_3_plen_56_part_01